MSGTRARSARGLIVDFDLLRIREKLASAPRTVQVKERKNYVESKSRRRRKIKIKTDAEKALEEEEKTKVQEEETKNEDKTEE